MSDGSLTSVCGLSPDSGPLCDFTNLTEVAADWEHAEVCT